MKKTNFWWYLVASQIILIVVFLLRDFLPENQYSDSILISNLAVSCEFDGVLDDGYRGVGLLYCPFFVTFDSVIVLGWLQFLIASILFYCVCNVADLKTSAYFIVGVLLSAYAIYYSVPSKDFLVSCSLLLLAASNRTAKIFGVILYLTVAFLVRKQLALILIVSITLLIFIRVFCVRKFAGYLAVYATIFSMYLLGWQFIYDDGVTSIRAGLTNIDFTLPVDTVVLNLYGTNDVAGDALNYLLAVATAVFPFVFFSTFKFYYIPFYVLVPAFFVAATYAATKGNNYLNSDHRVPIRVYIFSYIMVVLGYYPDYGALLRYLVPIAPLVFMQQSYLYKLASR